MFPLFFENCVSEWGIEPVGESVTNVYAWYSNMKVSIGLIFDLDWIMVKNLKSFYLKLVFNAIVYLASISFLRLSFWTP